MNTFGSGFICIYAYVNNTSVIPLLRPLLDNDSDALLDNNSLALLDNG